MEPLVSVIIPVYNTEKFLKKCLDSVLDQSYKSLEVILINDGSTDNSLEICKSYKAADSRIRLVDRENYGVSEARNYGVSCARGDYISFVDSDDWLDTNMFDEMIKIAMKTNADIVMSGFYINSKPYMEYCGRYRGVTQLEALELCYSLENNYSSGLWNKIFKADSLKAYLTFDKDLTIGEDMVVLTNSILNSNRIILYDKPFYHYFRWSGSTVASFNPQMITCVIAHQRVMALIDDKNMLTISIKKMLELRCSVFCYDYLVKAIKFGYLNRRVIMKFQNVVKSNIRNMRIAGLLAGRRKYMIYPLSHSFIFYWILATLNKMRGFKQWKN